VSICEELEEALPGLGQRDLQVANGDLQFLSEEFHKRNIYPWITRKNYSRELQRRMEKLTTRQRRVVDMKYVEGWRTAKCAEELGITPQAANARLRGALRRLRKEERKK
jgi:DNA-directed RNA polymerase specialized sigma24 family protein